MTGRVPDMTGPCGEAWEIGAGAPRNTDQQATVAAWFVHLPQSHSLWPRYLFSVVHLRDIPGQSRPPHRSYPEAEYEFLVVALDPNGRTGHPLSPEDPKSWRHLVPVNIVVQFDTGRPDTAAAEICRLVASSSGSTPIARSMDSVRPVWTELIRNTADHARGAHG